MVLKGGKKPQTYNSTTIDPLIISNPTSSTKSTKSNYKNITRHNIKKSFNQTNRSRSLIEYSSENRQKWSHANEKQIAILNEAIDYLKSSDVKIFISNRNGYYVRIIPNYETDKEYTLYSILEIDDNTSSNNTGLLRIKNN
jgi:hypothetical protein